MANYLVENPPVRPFNDSMSDETLAEYLQTHRNPYDLITALIEANRWQNKQIADLSRRIATLEDKTLKKPGRKRQSFHCPAFGDKELTDNDLCRLIDEGYFDSIGKMEKELYASDNKLSVILSEIRL